MYKNKVAEETRAIEYRPGGAKFQDIAHLVAGARGRKVFENGDPEAGIWTCGPCVGLIEDIPTCAQLLARIEADAESAILKMGDMVVSRAQADAIRAGKYVGQSHL